MNRLRPPLLAAIATAGVALALAFAPAEAAPPGAGGARHGGHGHYGRSHGGSWGWGLGLAIALPWALSYHDPWYWSPRYPYDPYYASVPAGCEPGRDCWIERDAPQAPAAPTTRLPASGAMAPAPAPLAFAGDAPTQRPLHLNYCEASRAWYPAVTACASGWRMTRSAYD